MSALPVNELAWKQEYHAMLCCPISGSEGVMQDPVRVDCPTGHTFERTAIEEWLKKRNVCPLCQTQVRSKALQSNLDIRSMIEFWNKMRSQRISLAERVQPISSQQFESIIGEIAEYGALEKDNPLQKQTEENLSSQLKLLNPSIESIQSFAHVFSAKKISLEQFMQGLNRLKEKLSPQTYESLASVVVFVKTKQNAKSADNLQRPPPYNPFIPSAPASDVDFDEKEPLLEQLSLHEEVLKGNIASVNRLIRKGANVHEQDKTGNTPLTYAKNTTIIKLLLEAGANIQRIGKDFSSKDNERFIEYVQQQDIVAVKDYLERGTADINLPIRGKIKGKIIFTSNTPLHQAIYGKEPKNTTMTLLLIRAGASLETSNEDGRTPLHAAAIVGSAAILLMLLRAGAEINAVDKQGRTPLMLAVTAGEEDNVSLLIREGAAVDKKDNNGLTAFLHAADYNLPRIMDILIRAGANIEARDKLGTTALHYVARRGMKEWMISLLEKVFSVDFANDNGITAAFWAAQGDQVEILEFLRTKGANLFAIGKKGGTLLHFAAAGNASKSILYLLNLGLNIEAVDQSNWTPLHWASKFGQEATAAVRALLDNHAKIESQDNEGNTPLHLAAQNNNLETTSVFLTYHANPNAKNFRNITPLHMSIFAKAPHIAQLLIQHGADVNAKATVTITKTYGTFDKIEERSGFTPLHLATNETLEGIIRILLDAGAKATTKDSAGFKPLAYTERGSDLRNLLIEKDKEHSCCFYLC